MNALPRIHSPLLLSLSLLLVAAVSSARAALPAPMVEGNTAFACDLYGRLKDAPGNLFFWPYSGKQIAMAVLLPRQVGSCDRLESELNPDFLAGVSPPYRYPPGAPLAGDRPKPLHQSRACDAPAPGHRKLGGFPPFHPSFSTFQLDPSPLNVRFFGQKPMGLERWPSG